MPRVSSVYKTSSKASSYSPVPVKISAHLPRSSLSTPTTTITPTKAATSLSFADNCSEMDAVNALLTMKSRSSSMPTCELNASTTSSSPQSGGEQTAKKGRRKQLLRPPIKNVMAVKAAVVDFEENNTNNNNNEEDVADDTSLDLNSDNSEDRLVYSNEEQLKETKSKKKLLVKFSCFKTSKQAAPANYINIAANDDDDEYDSDAEERTLKIDESFHDDEHNEEESAPQEKAEKPLYPAKKRKIAKAADTNNALLELSRAASIVEDAKSKPRASK